MTSAEAESGSPVGFPESLTETRRRKVGVEDVGHAATAKVLSTERTGKKGSRKAKGRMLNVEEVAHATLQVKPPEAVELSPSASYALRVRMTAPGMVLSGTSRGGSGEEGRRITGGSF